MSAPSSTVISGLTYDEHIALARVCAANLLTGKTATIDEQLPLLAPPDYLAVVEQVRHIAAVLRSQAGDRGTDLWVAVQ